MQVVLCFFGRVEVAVQLCLQALVRVDGPEACRHLVVGFALEGFDFFFAFYDESHGHTLHASGAEGGFDFAPEDGAYLVADEPVEHAARLLGVDEVHVDAPRVLYGVEDGRFGDFVEHDAPSVFLVEFQHLLQVPGDGLSLAVLIGCEPHAFGLRHGFFQVGDQLALVVAYLVLGHIASLYVDAHLFFRQVAYVPVARLHRVVLAQKFLYRLRLCRRLYYYQILHLLDIRFNYY